MSSMTLDTDALAQLYVPFEPIKENSGWNFTNSSTGNPTAYFLSQGTEYYFDKPTSVLTTQVPSSDILESMVNFAALITETAGSSSQYKQMVDNLNTWMTGVQNGAEVDILTVSGAAVNVQNNDGDDKTKNLTYVYVLFPTIGQGGAALLMQHSYTIDWSGTLQSSSSDVLAFGKDIGAYAGIVKTCVDAAEVAGEAIPGLDVIATIGLACTLTVSIAKRLGTDGSTDGRLNFIAVLTHGMVRTSSCVSPHSTTATQAPCIQASSLNAAWANETFDCTAQSGWIANAQQGTYFGTYESDSIYFAPYNKNYTPYYTQPYFVNMPEQSWLHGGVLTYATVMTYSDSTAIGLAHDTEKVFVLSNIVYGAGGNYISATAQSTDTNDPTAIVTDWFGSTNKGEINGAFANAVFGAVESCNVGTQPTLQLIYVVPPLLQSIVETMKLVPVPGVQPSATASIAWSSSAEVDKGNAPAVAIQNCGAVIACYDDNASGINTHLHWNYGTISTVGASVVWDYKDKGDKYQEGNWPSLATNSTVNTDVLSNFTKSSDIWWQAGSVDGPDKKVTFADAVDTSNGDHSSLFVREDNIAVLLFANTNNSLAYYSGTFTGGKFSASQPIGSPIDYCAGDYPTVLLSINNIVLAVHNYKQHLYYNVGTLVNNSITWGHGPYLFMIGDSPLGGSHPHLADLGNGRVVLTYDNDNKIYAAVGQIVNGMIQWYITNLSVTSGQYPAICGAAQLANTFVMCFNDTNGHIFAQTGVASFPA